MDCVAGEQDGADQPPGAGGRAATQVGVRAGIIVTGTEILTGRVSDRNGPWLAEQLRLNGVDVGRIVVVGDRAGDLDRSLAQLADDHDLLITTGGLGPTADDLTAERVAAFHGREQRLDPALQERISAAVAAFARPRGLRWDTPAMTAGIRKQAMVPQGCDVLEPVGTAPGLVVTANAHRTTSLTPAPVVVVLPGPPGELQAMWPQALAAGPVQELLSRTKPLQQNTIRLWGAMEADLAQTLRQIQAQIPDLEVTTCLGDGELEIVTRYSPDAENQLQLLREQIVRDFADSLLSDDGGTVDQVVAAALLQRGWTIATAESCTGGLLAARLTDLAGSSQYVHASAVVYSNAAKTALAGVPRELIEAHGAVSREVSEALASGARGLGADVGVGITGIAGPGGGTPGKPVGTVHLALQGPHGARHRLLQLRGDRQAVRQRTVTAAMHELRLLLRGDVSR